VRVFAALDKDAQARFAAELVDHWATHQRPGAENTEVDAEYLEVIAVRK
jgi:hypothetical protein